MLYCESIYLHKTSGNVR